MTTPPNPRDGLSDADIAHLIVEHDMMAEAWPSQKQITAFVRSAIAADREARPAPATSVLHYDRSTRDKFELGWNAALDRLDAASTPPAGPAIVMGWAHPDGRVVPAVTMDAARRDGGAMLSSLAGHTIPLVPASEARATGDAADGIDELLRRVVNAAAACRGGNMTFRERDAIVAEARAALSDRSTGAVPAGWDIKRAKDGIIVTGPIGGCFVWPNEDEPRVIPGEILYALADSLLAATGAAGEPQPREGWKPIETAPKDGTVVLGSLPDSDIAQPVRFNAGDWQHAWDDQILRCLDVPTHWMPLPEPPQADSGAAGGQADSAARVAESLHSLPRLVNGEWVEATTYDTMDVDCYTATAQRIAHALRGWP